VGRAVLITGAETDIGRATAVRLARKGFRAVAAVRSEAEAAVVARAAEHARVVVETILLDVTDAERCAQVIDELRPYGLVNNGGYAAGGAVEHVGDSGARMALETTIVTPMRLARLALPHMRAAGEGRIVNISSVFGCATTPLAGWHQAAKHALEGLSDALRVEVASAGIRVILIEPGAWAEMGRALEREAEAWRGSPYEAAYRRYVAGLRWAHSLTNDSAASVAAAVGRAMIALWPRARYVVGYEAALLALAERTLPTALKDRIARLLLGL
jgi:NAD(P)-dependent dehydrogenase (short-subunit alcohol dehydrogenase family)